MTSKLSIPAHSQHLWSLLDQYAATAVDNDYEREAVAAFRELLREDPRCFERDCWRGHVTGAAWIVNADATQVLLTHHRKLGRWLQLGGHSDGDPDTLGVARREGLEESGLALTCLDAQIFDLDVHPIPARKSDPEHFHFDVRFLFQAKNSQAFTISEESLDLAWVPMADLATYTDEESVLRLQRKWEKWERRAT